MAVQFTEPSGILDHLKELSSIIFPLLGIIGALTVYAWRKMEENVSRVERALSSHTDSDSQAHKELAQIQRKQDDEINELATKLAKLQGEHEAQHQIGRRP